MAATAEPILRDRTEEFHVLRRAAAQQRAWMEGKTPKSYAPGEEASIPEAAKPPSWVTVVSHFAELEKSVAVRLERLYFAQKAVFKPQFGADQAHETEEEMTAKVEKITEECKKFISELQRLLATGIRLQEESNPDEAKAAENVKRHLSSRLSELIKAFRDAQEQYGKQLKTRDERKKQFSIGSADVRERLDREERQSKYLTQGYSQIEINELLLMEEQAQQNSREIQNILASVTELNQMFQDLHDLVVEQGTVLDRIDYNIEQASEKVGKGIEELKKAREQQKKCSVA
jgi:syntaxin 16